MTNEYVIINKTAIQKRIEELKERQKEFLSNHPDDVSNYDSLGNDIEILEQILSQSTPLIPEIENAFYEGKNRMQHEIIEKLGLRYQTQQVSQSTILSMRVDSEDYISNLKLV